MGLLRKSWISAGTGLCFSVSIALAAEAAPTASQDLPAEGTLEPIEVNDRAPERDAKPYRDLIKAMDVFEEHHSKAPAATIRFKVFPWHDPVVMQQLTLTIRGKSVRRPIPLAEDGSFALERNLQALNEDAMVVSNLSPKSLAWRADIRTPGIPWPARRLGDLRLECQVDIDGSGAGLMTAFKPPAFWVMAALTDPCMLRGTSYGWFADEPVFALSLRAGERRANLPSLYLWASGPNANPVIAAIPDSYWDFLDHMRDRAFTLPIWNESWPDDTLVVFEPMFDVPAPARGAR